MEDNESNWMIDICDEIIFMLDNNQFNYTNSTKYNSLIVKLFKDYEKYIDSYNNQEEDSEKFFENYNQEESLAFDIFKALIKDSCRLINIDINNQNDIDFLEDYFNKIAVSLDNTTSAQVINTDPSTNLSMTTVISHANSNKKKFIKVNERRLDDIHLIKEQQRRIDLEQSFLYQKDINRKDKIIQNHYRTISILESQDLSIWKDQNNKLFYRPKAFEKEQKINKADIEDITKDLYAKVYDSTEDVQVINANYIIISLLPTVRKDIFCPALNSEFVFISNNLHDRNKFDYTKLLEKRLNSINDSLVINHNNFIEQFLELLFQNEDEFYFFIRWLSSFFYYLEKSNTALVLIGDNETTDIIMDFIIKPIFIKKKKYLSTINNSALDKERDNNKLLEDKIFYHVNNLNSKTDTKRVSKLIRSLVKPNHITPNEAWDNDEQYIHGELLVTASKESPYLYLKSVLSSCSVIRVKDIESVLNKLDMDYSDFEKSMTDDINNFTNKLVQYSQNNYSLTVLNTDEKIYLNTIKNGVLITPKIDRKINCFVEDILKGNIDAFHSIKQYDEDLYGELLYNFKEEMIAQPILSKYFNIIHEEELIPDNNEFIKILQEKAKMYNETPSDKSKYNAKKRYKIF
ncbi:hypothetical protein [Arcobacter peruensis]|uniref:hypothetical protein n=1 Tax=Arcobacter peruensis TaxID=2320140 RepID=UPI000F090974|nr:hypothetical protein [Arcobacter peruensis]